MEAPGWHSHHFGGHRCHGGGEGAGRPRQERTCRALSAPGGLQDEKANDRGPDRQSERPAQHPRETDAADGAQGVG